DLVLGTQDPFDCCTETVAVLLGNGDGTFQAGVAYYAGLNPAFVTLGDFNGDGKLDVVAGSESRTNILSVVLGNGNGTFQAAASFGAGWGPDSLATADLNGDGKLDIAAASSGTYDSSSGNYTNGSVEVLLGNGDGTFQFPA